MLGELNTVRACLVDQRLDALLYVPAIFGVLLQLLLVLFTMSGLLFDALIGYFLHELLLALPNLPNQRLHAVPVLMVVFILLWLPYQKLAGHGCWRLWIIVDEVEDAAPICFILVTRAVVEIL